MGLLPRLKGEDLLGLDLVTTVFCSFVPLLQQSGPMTWKSAITCMPIAANLSQSVERNESRQCMNDCSKFVCNKVIMQKELQQLFPMQECKSPQQFDLSEQQV